VLLTYVFRPIAAEFDRYVAQQNSRKKSPMNFERLVHGRREVSADFHMAAGRLWLEKGKADKLTTPLVYAAFEFRCATERAVVELYAIMQSELPSVEEMQDIGRFKNFMTKVVEVAGGNGKLLYRSLLFNSIVSEFMPWDATLSVPDVGTLQNHWHALSDLCHKQIALDPTWRSDDWVSTGYYTVQEAYDYLREIMVDQYLGSIPIEETPEEIQKAKKAFINEEIDKASLRTRLKLMTPILERRFRRRHAT